MTFDEYQREAKRTMTRADGEELGSALHGAIMGLGLSGEAGEVADLLKKKLGHGHRVTLAEMEKELGDVLWYLAAVSEWWGIDLDEVARLNIEKLRKRYPDGFTHKASRERSTAGLTDRGNGSGGESE